MDGDTGRAPVADAAGRRDQLHDHGSEHRQPTLTGVVVTDPNADAVPGIVRGADAVGDGDNLLDVGETWALHGASTR